MKAFPYDNAPCRSNISLHVFAFKNTRSWNEIFRNLTKAMVSFIDSLLQNKNVVVYIKDLSKATF